MRVSWVTLVVTDQFKLCAQTVENSLTVRQREPLGLNGMTQKAALIQARIFHPTHRDFGGEELVSRGAILDVKFLSISLKIPPPSTQSVDHRMRCGLG